MKRNNVRKNKKVEVFIKPDLEDEFIFAKNTLGFVITSRKEKYVDDYGFDQLKGYGNKLLKFTILMTEFQYRVFKETAKRLDIDNLSNRGVIEERYISYTENGVTEEELESVDKAFKQYQLPGWLFSRIIEGTRLGNDIQERFVVFRQLESEGNWTPEQMAESGLLSIATA